MAKELTHWEVDAAEDRQQFLAAVEADNERHERRRGRTVKKNGVVPANPLHVPIDAQGMVCFTPHQKIFLGLSSVVGSVRRWTQRAFRLDCPVVVLAAAGDTLMDNLSALGNTDVVLVNGNGSLLKDVSVSDGDLFVLNGASEPVQWAMMRLAEGGRRGQVIRFRDTDWIVLAPLVFSPPPIRRQSSRRTRRKK